MSLASEDYLSIVLAIVLLLLIIAIIVVILIKNGYCERKTNVSPTKEVIDDGPKLVSNFSRSGNSLYSLSIGRTDTSTPRFEFKPGPEANPIIYLYDDIYYPPSLASLGKSLQAPDICTTETGVLEERKTQYKLKQNNSKRPSGNRPPLPHRGSKVVKDGINAPNNITIPDTGIDIYTRYGYNDPYDD